MKIALPTENKDINSMLCASFGRAPYYLIYDTVTQSSVFVDNTAAASAGGAGIKAAQLLIDSSINALIAPRCGQNAALVLQAAGIALYQSKDAPLAQNIALLQQGKLEVLSSIHAGFHNH